MVASGKDVAVVAGVIGIIIAVIVAGRQAFGAISGIKLPEITLPDINLPTINFPEIPNPFEGFEFPTFEFPTIEFPTFEFPDFSNIFGGLFGGGPGGMDQDMMEEDGPAEFFETGPGGARSERGEPEPGPEPFRDAARFAEDFPEPFIPREPTLENLNVQTEIPGQQFFGGGPSFIGGTVFETPIENLSLSQIISMGLASSATEAANLRAIAQGFTPEEEAFLNQGAVDVGGFVSGGPPAVSDPQFQGLSATEIFRRLVGGVISNF